MATIALVFVLFLTSGEKVQMVAPQKFFDGDACATMGMAMANGMIRHEKVERVEVYCSKDRVEI